MARTRSGETVLSRAVRLVEAFRQGEEWLTVSELARRTGLHLATASRLVTDLTEHGWRERDEARRVRLGVRLWEVAARASSALSLREAAMPVLEDRHAQVRRHAQSRPGHQHPDATGIDAPVLRRGQAVATLAVVVPDVPQPRHWAPLLRIAAAEAVR